MTWILGKRQCHTPVSGAVSREKATGALRVDPCPARLDRDGNATKRGLDSMSAIQRRCGCNIAASEIG